MVSVARRTSACTTSSAELRSQTQRSAVSTSTLAHTFPEQAPGRPGWDGTGADGGVIRDGGSAFLASAGGVTAFGSAGFGSAFAVCDGFAGGGISARRAGSAGFVEAGVSTVRGVPIRCAVTYDCEGSVLASARPSAERVTRFTQPPRRQRSVARPRAGSVHSHVPSLPGSCAMVPSGLIDTTPPVNHFHLPTSASQGAPAPAGSLAPA